MAGRYLETAMATLRSIEDPSDINPIEAIFSRQKKAEANLRERLAEAQTDLKASQFAASLNGQILCELEEPEELEQLVRQVSEDFTAHAGLISSKVEYLDLRLGAQVNQKAEVLRAGLLHERTVAVAVDEMSA